MENFKRTSIILSEKQWVELKIHCVLTHSKMGDFIRKAIADKIKELKRQHDRSE